MIGANVFEIEIRYTLGRLGVRKPRQYAQDLQEQAAATLGKVILLHAG